MKRLARYYRCVFIRLWFFLVCVLILMAVTHTAWVTYDTNWLNVLKFMLIAPLVIMVLVASWLIASYIRTERLLKTFIETPAESPRMEEADTYLRALLSSGTLRERNYPKVREARTACFKDGRIVSRKIRDYCQILYDIDPEYAKKMISRIPVLTKHLHPLNIPAKQPPLLTLPPLTLLLPALSTYRHRAIMKMMTVSLLTWKKPSTMISCSTVAIPSTGILAATTWMIPLDSAVMMETGERTGSLINRLTGHGPFVFQNIPTHLISML